MKIFRILSIFLLLIMAMSCFISCGDNKTNDADTEKEETDMSKNELPVEYKEIDGVKYKLTFYDDFDGDKLDTTKWELCPEWQRQNVGGYWNNKMTELDGKGHLVLSADINKDGTPISGAVRTKGIFEQAKGYFEIKCTVQSAPGFWSAFWLMCPEQKNIGNGACDGAEIDIFEAHNVNTKGINHAIHWDGYGEHHRSISTSVTSEVCYDGGYHTYALLWTDTAYIFYIDGVESYRISEGDDNYPGCNQFPTYLKISLEFGTWAGKYDIATLPDGISVDYVKVYAPE